MPSPGTPCSWFACRKPAVAVLACAVAKALDPVCEVHAARLAKTDAVVFHKPEPLELARWTGPIPDAVQVMRFLEQVAA
jgi:hypothetical protein